MYSKPLLAILFLFTFFSYSQKLDSIKMIDSLSHLEYSKLTKEISFKNKSKSKFILKAYLKKAKREKDTLELAHAYRNLYLLNSDSGHNFYADSIIKITKKSDYKDYPLIGYFYKGVQLYSKGDYAKALDYFIKARHKSESFMPEIERYIGTLKTRLGYYDEALEVYTKSMRYYKDTDFKKGLLSSYFALSDVTRFLKQMDSSIYYCDLGYKLADEVDKSYKPYFLFNKGATLSDMKVYDSSLYYLNNALPKIIEANDKSNTAIAHFFIGRNFKNLKKTEKSIYHLKQMDSIFLEVKDLNPELREGYEILINHYKKNKDIYQELTYVKRMLKVDSIIHLNYTHLDKKINKEYTRLKLQVEKKKLNKEINLIKQTSLYKIVFASLIIISLILLLIFKHFKHEKDKHKFDLLIKESAKKTKRDAHKRNSIDINDEVVKKLLSKLEEFEMELGFLNSNLTRDDLAKQMNTNLAYLSKVINYSTEKTYTNYINDLRIDYTIKQLKSTENPFLKWSVNAIAREVGFKNSEPFSKAFFKRTGIKPSFFIKELKKTH